MTGKKVLSTNFMLIDDDDAIRYMLQDIIEEYRLGEVVDSLSDARALTNELLRHEQVDILILDMLMEGIDGMAAAAAVRAQFTGKIIMLSQVESKELVGKAYEMGVDYYITKPLNRNEILGVIRNVSKHIRLEHFAHDLQSSLKKTFADPASSAARPSGRSLAHAVLKELGIADMSGAKDLMAILHYLAHTPNDDGILPPLQRIFSAVLQGRAKEKGDISKEVKAMEQRLRRTISQALLNLAAMGALDYTNPRFESYAPLYFDYAEVRRIMTMMDEEKQPKRSDVHINMKKFIHALFRATQE